LERSSQVTKFGEFEVDPLPDWQPVQHSVTVLLTWSATCCEPHCGVTPADDCLLQLHSADENTVTWLKDKAVKVVAKLANTALNLFTIAKTVCPSSWREPIAFE